MRFIIELLLCLQLLMPFAANSQTIMKTPLSYSLSEYGVVLATALLGGVASWFMKVRRGEILVWNLSALIGELCVSAFAGLLAFWLCEWLEIKPLLTAAIVAMAGHAGAKGISWAELLAQRVVEKKLGIDQ